MSAWRGIKRIQMLLSEMVGTYFIVLSYGLSMADVKVQDGAAAALQGPMSVGLAVLSQTYAFAHVSLAQFNPAVTMGLLLTQSISVLDAIMAMAAQVLAGLMAGFTVSSIASTVAAPHPASDDFSGNIHAAAVELLFTFAVVLVALNSLRDMPNSYYGMAVGLTVLGAMSAAMPYSGGGCVPFCVNMHGQVTDHILGGCTSVSLVHGAYLDKFRKCADAVTHFVVGVGSQLASMVGGALAAGAFMLVNKSDTEREEDEDGVLVESNLYEHHSPAVISVLLVELLGTFFLTLTSSLSENGMATGCMLTAMVYMGNRISGGEYNPAVTFGVALRSRAPFGSYVRVMLKSLTQILGALLAGFVTYGIADEVTYPNPDGSNGLFNSFVFETLFAVAWIMVVLCVATPTSDLEAEDGLDEKAPQSFYGLAIGLTVASGVYCAGKHSGASGGVFNPAVGTGLCVTDELTGGSSGSHIWIYWAGPLLASLIAAMLFSLTHSRQERFGYRPV